MQLALVFLRLLQPTQVFPFPFFPYFIYILLHHRTGQLQQLTQVQEINRTNPAEGRRWGHARPAGLELGHGRM